MPVEFESTDKPDYILQDHFYGKGGVKLLNLVKNGKKVFQERLKGQKVIFRYRIKAPFTV